MKKIFLQSTDNPTFEEALASYIRKCKIKNLADKTILVYTEDIADFLKHCGEEIEYIKEVTESTVENYMLNRKTETCSQISVNSHLRSIRAFLYWCMEEKYITRPFMIYMPKVEQKVKETYSDSELKTLLKKPNIMKVSFSTYKTWVYSNYLLATGNRISSALGVKIKNLDFDSSMITIEVSKNKKQQIIPMSPALANVLIEYLKYRKGKSEDFLFCNQYGERVTTVQHKTN